MCVAVDDQCRIGVGRRRTRQRRQSARQKNEKEGGEGGEGGDEKGDTRRIEGFIENSGDLHLSWKPRINREVVDKGAAVVVVAADGKREHSALHFTSV